MLEFEELSKRKLEGLIDQIPNQGIRAIKGLENFSLNSEQGKDYFKQYIQALIEGNNHIFDDIHDKGTHNFANFAIQGFKSLPIDERKELGEEYFSWQFSSLNEDISINILQQYLHLSVREGLLENVFSLAKETNLVPEFLETTQSYINNKFSSLKDLSRETDKKAKKLADLVKHFNVVRETQDSAMKYFQRRLKSVKNPTSVNDLNMHILYYLAETYDLPTNLAGLSDLDLATKFFSYSADLLWGDLVSSSEKDKEQGVEKAWELAQILWEKTPEANFGNLINNKIFQKKYSSNETAKTIAKYVIVETLKDEKIKRAKELFDIYNLSESDEIVEQGTSASLEDGHYQLAEQIAELFNYEIPNEVYGKARLALESKINDSTNAGDLYAAITATLRLKSFDQFRQEGIDVDMLPEDNLSLYASENIIILEFQSRIFLRSDKNSHKNIYEKFCKEVNLMGFAGKPSVKGGANITYFDETRKLEICAECKKYGKCNKEVLKNFVQKEFPNDTVEIYI